MMLEKRISPYSISPIKDSSLSLMDNILSFYKRIVAKISKIITPSVFVQKYSKRYDKYVGLLDGIHNNSIDFLSSKIFISFIFLLIAIFSKTIQYKTLSIYEICIPMILGFFILDIIYFSKYKIYRSHVENDLLQAIIIMNNAFKSGRSITQAIELVTYELKGPVAEQFKKMNLELSFGLDIETVFKRFADRIKLEEVTYLTASLTILNKTGGNIIKVFSSIEKSLFNKKKLKLELSSLTGSSKIIVNVLFLIPIFFILVIQILDPTYFVPFYTENKYKFLLDFNEGLQQVVLDLLNLEPQYQYSDEYKMDFNPQEHDFREIIHPKKDYQEVDSEFIVKPYYQVFQEKHGFSPNLSIIDLLFNKGPESVFYLDKSLLDE